MSKVSCEIPTAPFSTSIHCLRFCFAHHRTAEGIPTIHKTPTIPSMRTIANARTYTRLPKSAFAASTASSRTWSAWSRAA